MIQILTALLNFSESNHPPCVSSFPTSPSDVYLSLYSSPSFPAHLNYTMPAPKVKATSSNGSAASKSKGSKSGNGISTPVPVPPTTEEHLENGASTSSGRPDKAVYDAEQEKLKKDIDNAQAKLVCHVCISVMWLLISDSHTAVCCKRKNIASY